MTNQEEAPKKARITMSHKNCTHPKTFEGREACRQKNGIPSRGKALTETARLVNDHGGPITGREVAEALGLTGVQATTRLGHLVKRGMIKHLGRGLYASLDYDGGSE